MTGSRKIVPSCLSVIQVDLGADATKDRRLLPGRIVEGAGDSAVKKCRELPYEATNADPPISQQTWH